MFATIRRSEDFALSKRSTYGNSVIGVAERGSKQSYLGAA